MFLRQELDQLRARIQTLEDRIKPAQSELSSPSATSPEDDEDTGGGAGSEEGEERDAGSKGEKGGDEESGSENQGRENATMVIQRNWRKHRKSVGSRPRLCKSALIFCPRGCLLISIFLHSI